MSGTNGGESPAHQHCGEYCGEGVVLSSMIKKLGMLAEQIIIMDNRSGEVLGAAIKAEQAADRAATEAKRSRVASEAISAKMCGGANQILEKYASTHPPILDNSIGADEASELTQTEIMTPKLSLQRIRKAESAVEEANADRVRVEVEKVMKDRECEAYALRTKKLETLRLWMLAVTPFLVAIGSIITYLLGRR